MSKFRVFVKTALEKHPLVTNSIIYGSFCTISEFSQQTSSKKFKTPPESYDTPAIARFAIYGTAIAGPLLYGWYGKILDKAIVGSTFKISMKKLLIDQFTFTPGLLGVFFVSMSLMERKEDIFEECKQKFLPTFRTSCMFWIPAQLVNFMLVPPLLRVTYIGGCSFAWINILCYIKRQDVETDRVQLNE
ncbi:unnamed protein product [Phyllotreta striolata]|uniref:Mpv17-like protein n=1 Tax=Phyllotreta striolata TaxID=444603 RepID=A0A9N9TKY4_PHYSR|nr:unnamed protein product [Phyllotreta striolata]